MHPWATLPYLLLVAAPEIQKFFRLKPTAPQGKSSFKISAH